MKKILLLLIACSYSTYCQSQDSVQTELLKNAPPHIKKYCQAFDSLTFSTSQGTKCENWTLEELKKYSSYIYLADEYDPIAKIKYNRLLTIKAKKDHKRWITDGLVVKEVKNRISEKYSNLIHDPLWLTIIIDSVKSFPETVNKNPLIQMTKIKIFAKISQIWKGSQYNVGNSITIYYMKEWGINREIIKGNSYIVPLISRILDDTDEIENSIDVKTTIFLIINKFVLDDHNLFGLGNKVPVNNFTQSLQSRIDEIKSWGKN